MRTTPTTKIRMVAGTGVWVRGLTRRITLWAGKRASRAIAYTCREPAAMITIPEPNIANTIADNRIRSVTGPSCSRMIDATGDPLAVTLPMSFMARVAGNLTRRALVIRRRAVWPWIVRR